MYGYEWAIFCALAFATAIMNVVFTIKGRDSRVFMFASLSFTALTLYASRIGDLQIVASMGADEDLMFTPILLLPTLASILLNSIGLFGRRKK